MTFYYLIFFVLSLFVLLEGIRLDRRFLGLIYTLFCLSFFFLSFIRWETGTDWKNYYNYFESIENLDFETDSYELGFHYLNKLVKFISDDYTVLLIFSGAILFFFQSIAIKRMSPYPLLSLLFLWSTQFANVLFVRQWIAVVILFCSTVFIEKRKPFLFVIFVLIACSFHRTSFLFLLSWWIYNLDFSKKKMIIILILSILVSLLLTKVMEFIAGNLGGVVQAKLDGYLDEDYNSSQKEELNIVSVMLRGFSNKLLILITSFYFYKRIVNDFPVFKGYLNIYWFGAIVYFMTLPVSLVLVRMSYAFDFFQIILAAFIFAQFKSKHSRLIFLTIFLIYLILRLTQTLNGPYMEEYVPFKTILD
ncbi:EpsG family protein [Sphingobacterium sp. MYb382]|uniref:EpsG family protein n=1 Tax=Sphingobacterium sp. MYb382 TaxID=2745278 RepID=UPI0030A98D59